VSWQLVSLAILAAVLAGGFWWYERSRPPSRIVALVASLAALAVAGRIAFAPIPNVLATTDIVLIAGYAVGGGPGFVVGALAALVSNFWLGQGPWTPWQMAGWGMVGIGGAALAVATGRRLGRLGIAIACAVAGLAYGALLDLSVMVTYGGEQSLDRYLAISARGVPFNVAHAAGNFVLALVAGPAMVRMLVRFRARSEFRWRPRAAAVPLAAIAVAVVIALPAGALASPGSARGWLVEARNPDGGFATAPGGSSGAAMTGWAMLGLESAGRNPRDLGGKTPVVYLRANAKAVRSAGDIERTILALEGAGLGARDFAGRDLVGSLRNKRDRDGSFQGQVNLTAFGVMALRAAGSDRSSLKRSAGWLRGARNKDGGWGFQPDEPSDPDSTGAALQAIVAAGGGGKPAAEGVRYLKETQERDGGWALAEAGPSNSQSTAWAVQGLIAAGADPAAVTRKRRSPFEFLAARQAGDGHYRYSAASDQTPVWVTSQVLAAVERETFPIAAVARVRGGGGGGTGGGGGAANGGGGVATAGGGGLSGRGGSGDNGGGAGEGKKAGGAERGSARKAGESPTIETEEPPPAEFDEASSESDEPSTLTLVLAGIAVLAVAGAAGWFVYRRRATR